MHNPVSATTVAPSVESPPSSSHSPGHTAGRGRLWPLMLGALGVVYGDIGTSPLYTLKESLHAMHGFTHASALHAVDVIQESLGCVWVTR